MVAWWFRGGIILVYIRPSRRPNVTYRYPDCRVGNFRAISYNKLQYNIHMPREEEDEGTREAVTWYVCKREALLYLYPT